MQEFDYDKSVFEGREVMTIDGPRNMGFTEGEYQEHLRKKHAQKVRNLHQNKRAQK